MYSRWVGLGWGALSTYVRVTGQIRSTVEISLEQQGGVMSMETDVAEQKPER